MDYAIKSHKLTHVLWVKSKSHEINHDPLYMAIEFGTIEIMDYFIQNESTIHVNPSYNSAIRSTNIEHLQWLRDRNYHHTVDNLEMAIKLGNLSVVRWLLAERTYEFTYRIAYYAERTPNNVPMMQLLYDAGCRQNRYISIFQHGFDQSMFYTNIEWLCSKGCLPGYAIYSAIFTENNIYLLTRFKELGFDINAIHASEAIVFANTSTLDWLKANGYILTTRMYKLAARVCKIKNLQWLYDNDAPLGKITLDRVKEWNVDTFAMNRKIAYDQVVTWFAKNGVV